MSNSQKREATASYAALRANILKNTNSLDGIFRCDRVDDGGCIHTFEIIEMAGGEQFILHTRRTQHSIESVVDWDVWQKKGETTHVTG